MTTTARRLLTAAATAALLAAALPAAAAPIAMYNTAQKVTGIDGILVGTTLMNVDFVKGGSCNATFGDCSTNANYFFKTAVDAVAARDALLAAFASTELTHSNMEGCSLTTNLTTGASRRFGCYFYTPHTTVTSSAGSLVFSTNASLLDDNTSFAYAQMADSAANNLRANSFWAIWSAVPVTTPPPTLPAANLPAATNPANDVPEPASLALALAGVGAVVGVRRRNTRAGA